MSTNVDLRLIAGMGPQLFTAPTVAGLPVDLQATLEELVNTLSGQRAPPGVP